MLPHEADLRRWLQKSVESSDVEDVIQESYARIAGLDSVAHIRSGRAYLYTVAKMIVVIELRKIEGLSQREAAAAMNVAEHTIEYEGVRGLRMILKAMRNKEEAAEIALRKLDDERARDSRGD